MAFSFPSFVFFVGFGGRLFPPIKSRGFVTLTVTPPRSWGSRNLPLALGSGWSWTPETRWRDVASETWRSYRFFSEGLIRTTDATSQRWGEKGGDGYTVCSHVKKCQICRNFLKGFGEWWNYGIDQMVKCFSSLHSCAFGGHSLGRFLLRPLPTGRTQKRARMMALSRVKGACCMPFVFASGDQHVLCVKTRCNYGKWRAMMIPARE